MANGAEGIHTFPTFLAIKVNGFTYEIQYKKGKENFVADALSRIRGAELLHMALSSIDSDLATQIAASWQLDSRLQDIIQQF